MTDYSSIVKGADFAGVDQGIDFTGKGTVYALGPGVVTRRMESGSGWPGEGALFVYKITSGKFAGRYVYTAEDFAPVPWLTVGAKVVAGQVIGAATGSGRAPGIETGWATSSGTPVAKLLPRGSDYAAAGETAGRDFQAAVSGGDSGSGGFLNSILPYVPFGGIFQGGISKAPGNIAALPGNLSGDAKSLTSLVTTPLEFAKAIWDFFAKGGIIRLLQIVGGALLILAGLFILARDAGVPIPSPTR